MPFNKLFTIVARSRAGGPFANSTTGAKYLSMRETDRFGKAGIEPSVSSVADSYDNALAKTINGLFKAQVIHRHRSRRDFKTVELATLDWFDNRRLLKRIGKMRPAQADPYVVMEPANMAAQPTEISPRQTRSGSVFPMAPYAHSCPPGNPGRPDRIEKAAHSLKKCWLRPTSKTCQGPISEGTWCKRSLLHVRLTSRRTRRAGHLPP